MPKKSKSPLVERQLTLDKDFESYGMNAAEAEQYGQIIKKIIYARNQREMTSDYFDGMNYEAAYLSNKRAAMSYLQPKRNDDEVRINTGTTEKRIELVLNELLALNFEGEVRAFDKDDNLLVDVGDALTDITKRTKQIEHSKDKNVYYYRELITQPSVFVEELFVKEMSAGSLKTRKRCESRMLQGVQMYLGDVNLPDIRFNSQPYLVKYVRMSYEEGEFVFKDMNPERWKNVRPGPYLTIGTANTKLYRTGSLMTDEIEAFCYMSYQDNEVQWIVNGVPFLSVGHKYTDEYGDLGGYHITMVGLQPYGWDFAYSKPLTQSAKTLQALDNETIRNLIRKFRQALEPPMGIKGSKSFSRDIWNPGSMVNGITKDNFEKLIDHVGVTRSEMGMFDLIEKKVNEFIGTSQSEPLQNKSQVTATELTLAQKNAVKMLGSAVLAVMRLEQRLTMLRVKNIKLNYTKPVGKTVDPITNKVQDIYARFSLDGADLGDQKGTKIIQMMDRSSTREEDEMIYREEQKAKKLGNPFKYIPVNAKALDELELYFYVSVIGKPQENSEMDKALLTEMINQGIGITNVTGRQMNPNKLVDKFERIYKEKDFFQKDAPPPMPGMGGEGGPGAVPAGAAGQKMQDMNQMNGMKRMDNMGMSQ